MAQVRSPEEATEKRAEGGRRRGAAGSGLLEATDRSAAERLGAALLGNILSIFSKRIFFSDIYQNCCSGHSATILLVATKTALPAAPTTPLSPLFRGLLWEHVCTRGNPAPASPFVAIPVGLVPILQKNRAEGGHQREHKR